jgi:hypothetical protein
MVMAPAVARAATPVPAVQQPVEQRAQQHQQIRQGAEDVGGVLGEKEEGGNGGKPTSTRPMGERKKLRGRNGCALVMMVPLRS